MANPRIRFPRRDADGWAETDPVLLRGEPGFETDTGRLKIGDGESHWTELDYIGISDRADLRKVSTVLDNEAILQLSETPYEIIEPSEVINYEGSVTSLPLPIAAHFSIRVDTGYGNFNDEQTNSLYLCHGSDESQDTMFVVDMSEDVEFGIPKIKRADMRYFMTAVGVKLGRFYITSNPHPADGQYMDNGLYLKLSTPGVSGSLTGGDENNWLKITVWYESVDLIP